MRHAATPAFALVWVIAYLWLGEPATYVPLILGMGLCLWIDLKPESY